MKNQLIVHFKIVFIDLVLSLICTLNNYLYLHALLRSCVDGSSHMYLTGMMMF